jgi:hypothetical protein
LYIDYPHHAKYVSVSVDIILPFCRLSSTSDLFFPSAIKMWNILNNNIRNSDTLSKFKSELKKIDEIENLLVHKHFFCAPRTLNIISKIFCSESTRPVETKLGLIHHSGVQFQNCVRWSRAPTNMALLLKIEHMLKLQVLGNNSKTVNNIKNLTRVNNDQHSTIYLPCNFEVNLIIHLGVIALFSSFCFNFNTFRLIFQKL